MLSPSLAVGSLAMASLRAMAGFTTFLIAFSFRRAHVSTWWFGLVLVFSVIGGLAGTAAAPRLRDRVKEEHIVVGALVAVAVLGLAMAELGGTFAAAVLAAGVGFAASGGKQAIDSLVQRDAPRAVQARAFARFEATFQLVWVLGALLPVVLPIGERLGFVLIACGAAATGVIHVVSRHQKGAPPIRWPADESGDPTRTRPFPAVVPPPLSGPPPP